MDEFNNIKNKNGFKIPDGYFDSFADRMAEMVKDKPIEQTKTFSLKPFLYMAAMFMGVLVISWSVFSFFNKNSTKIASSDALAYLEYNIDDISDDLLYESANEDELVNDENYSLEEIDYLEEELTEDEIYNNFNY